MSAVKDFKVFKVFRAKVFGVLKGKADGPAD